MIARRTAQFAPLPPAPSALPPAPSTELQQVGAVLARIVATFPAATTLVCLHPERGRAFWVTTSRAQYALATRARFPVLHGLEWLDLVDAAEAGRACLAIEQWLAPAHDPGWIVSRGVAGYIGQWDMPDHWQPVALSIHEVLAHYRCKLIGIDPDPDTAPRQEGLL